MADLFTRAEVEFGGAFTSQLGIIGSSQGNLGVLMQNLTLNYSQQVTRIYELGVAGLPINAYYVGGRSAGNVVAGHIVGPGVNLSAFYATFGDVCQARCNMLQLNLGPNVCDGVLTPNPAGGNTCVVCDGGVAVNNVCIPLANNLNYTAKFCVLTAIGMSVSVADFVINENSTIMFTGLDFGAPPTAQEIVLNVGGVGGGGLPPGLF